ncbi:hypothetical protein C1646_723553 [Rhizophagus diaphanus]|nr:hypothetical protein C1646_723553 [Rhizophagus diaphanus] [Rhizophagus sp. MUCL 43196]
MSEIQVWENVLKWGIAQNPKLSFDPTIFSKEDFNTLKNSIQQFIPYIKFYNLTSEEFSAKVLPYKKVLPKELYKDLLKNYLCPSKPKGIDSKIITFQVAELISKWINRLEITDEVKNLYEYKLILRGSRDGFTPEKFHEICDNHSHTVTIVKVKGSNEILGGYNPIDWKSDGSYSTTKDSFIFSFEDNNNVENHVLSRVKYEKYAAYNLYWFGPSFGADDLSLCNCNVGSCHQKNYENPIRVTEKDFYVEDYEVFKIIRI